jgi:hypothetical protein
MDPELSKYLESIEKGEKISLVTAGMVLDGVFEEVANNCVVLSSATSRTSKKKRYHLTIPFENIYARGRKQKKAEEKKSGKKIAARNDTEQQADEKKDAANKRAKKKAKAIDKPQDD